MSEEIENFDALPSQSEAILDMEGRNYQIPDCDDEIDMFFTCSTTTFTTPNTESIGKMSEDSLSPTKPNGKPAHI